MPGDTGFTAQEIDAINQALSPGGVGGGSNPQGELPPGYNPYAQPDPSAMRNQMAQLMASRGGGGGGDPYAAYRAQMAQRASQPQGDPYAAYRAQMASRAQPAAAGGGGAGMWYDPSTPTGGNPWKTGTPRNFLAEAQKSQEENPYDQYFAAKGPMSGSGDDMNWMNALQPWQGGSTGVSGSGGGYNTSGFLMGGGQMRADPAYWGWTGPGTNWSPGGVIKNWMDLRANNPFAFQNFGGQGGMDAGIAGGFGPGEGAGGGGFGGGGLGGSGPGGGGTGGTSAASGNFGGYGSAAAFGGALGNALSEAAANSNVGDATGWGGGSGVY